MPVTVKIPTIMRRHVGGESTVQGSGQTLGEVLADLEARYPGLTGDIVAEGGALHRLVNVYVNGEDVRFLGSLQTQVNEGDTVAILPAVAGGAVSVPARAS